MRTLAIVVACGVLVGLAGCGSSGSTSSTTQPQHQSNAATSPQPTSRSGASARAGASAPASASARGGAGARAARTSSKSSTLMRTYGSVATFGHRASAGDRASVLAAFHAYLSAIATGDWTAACEQLATPVKNQLQALLRRAGGTSGRCAPALGALLGRVSSSARQTLAQVDVIAVRTNGDHAFVLYRSNALPHASISMFREAGRWTAGVLSATMSG